MRTIAKWFLGGTVLFAAAAVVWKPIAEPALVKFPTSVDTKLQYKGQFVQYKDPSTGATLAAPVTAPLVLDRVYSSPSGSSSSKALVDEKITVTVAGKVTGTQDNLYVLDRRDNINVADSRAYAIVPSNKVDRAGLYTIQFPMNFKSSETYKLWNTQTATSETLRRQAVSSGKIEGLDVARMTSATDATPVASYYNAVLSAQGLPTQLTAAQMQAQLKAAGIDVNAALTGLASVVTPQELQVLQQTFSSPVPLKYYFKSSGDVAIETKTGTPLEVRNATETILVAPDLTGMAPAVTILTKYAAVPTVSSALTTFQALSSAGPTPVYDLSFSQTPATVSSLASDVKSQINKMSWVQTYIPLILAGIAVILLIATLVTRKPRHPEERVEVIPPEREVPKAA